MEHVKWRGGWPHVQRVAAKWTRRGQEYRRAAPQEGQHESRKSVALNSENTVCYLRVNAGAL